MDSKNMRIFSIFLVVCLLRCSQAHEAKDFDDSVLYKIEFDMPDFDKEPHLRQHLRSFYTHEQEKYDCVIPVLQEPKEEIQSSEAELSPYLLLQPIFSGSSCSYRIEGYWSYEICHGQHVRQYHEEREGKSVKFQEFYLGKFSQEKNEKTLIKDWEDSRKVSSKYKTTKIDDTKYPYFEVEMTDGTLCDIINAPRTTVVRYVCYPHGKNEIYSFKETSSCNYEAIILTSLLCMIPAFHAEESKETSIKCFNSATNDVHKPLSMLKQELSELQMSNDDFPGAKEGGKAAMALARTVAAGERYMFLNKMGSDVDKLVLELMVNAGVDVDTTAAAAGAVATNAADGDAIGTSPAVDLIAKAARTPVTDMTPIKEFISGKHCLTGGTGWWKYEFCYGRHVRQFHKDKKSETELFLGYFNEQAHKQWLANNPEKVPKSKDSNAYLWHHYEQGSRCDRTGQPREVDVKLSCAQMSHSITTVSMYLLEPKTCQYILVVESPVVCELSKLADEHGLVQTEKLQKMLETNARPIILDLSELAPVVAQEKKAVAENKEKSKSSDSSSTAAPTATAAEQQPLVGADVLA